MISEDSNQGEAAAEWDGGCGGAWICLADGKTGADPRLHVGLTQGVRLQPWGDARSGLGHGTEEKREQVLVATDVVARGIDTINVGLSPASTRALHFACLARPYWRSQSTCKWNEWFRVEDSQNACVVWRQVAHVINFDFPLNAVDYIHRAGRTGAHLAPAPRPTSATCRCTIPIPPPR